MLPMNASRCASDQLLSVQKAPHGSCTITRSDGAAHCAPRACQFGRAVWLSCSPPFENRHEHAQPEQQCKLLSGLLKRIWCGRSTPSRSLSALHVALSASTSEASCLCRFVNSVAKFAGGSKLASTAARHAPACSAAVVMDNCADAWHFLVDHVGRHFQQRCLTWYDLGHTRGL